eukprot:g34671.t1
MLRHLESWLFLTAELLVFALYHHLLSHMRCASYASLLKKIPLVTWPYPKFVDRVQGWCVWDTSRDISKDFVTLTFPNSMSLLSGTDFLQAAPVTPRSVVPRIMHHVWRDRRVPVFAERPWLLYLRSWLQCFPTPNWTHVLWVDAELPLFVGRYYPDFLDTYLAYDSNIMRSDSARILLLDSFGGLYADMDCECFKEFEQLLIDVGESFGVAALQVPYMKGMQNSLMYSPPGHPLWTRVKYYLEHQRWFTISMHSKTGSNLLVAASHDLGANITMLSDALFGYTSRKETGGFARHHGSSSWSWANHRRYELRIASFLIGLVIYLSMNAVLSRKRFLQEGCAMRSVILYAITHCLWENHGTPTVTYCTFVIND